MDKEEEDKVKVEVEEEDALHEEDDYKNDHDDDEANDRRTSSWSSPEGQRPTSREQGQGASGKPFCAFWRAQDCILHTDIRN
jgi:hypothetical protein